jgi:hypothetical protein
VTPRRAIVWLCLYAAALGFVAGLVLACLRSPAYLGFLVLPFLASAPWAYVLSPIWKVLGIEAYYSAFLRSTPGPSGSLVLHLGTVYDLLWRVIPARQGGEPLARTVRREIYRGLLRLCERAEAGEIPPQTRLLVITYVAPPAQVARLGFHGGVTSVPLTPESTLLAWGRMWQKIQYLDIMLARTAILGRVRGFDTDRILLYEATAGELAARSPYIRSVFARLSPATLEGRPGENPGAMLRSRQLIS